MKTWALLPALLWGQLAVGFAAPSITMVSSPQETQNEPDLLKDLYWRCGARQRLEFGKAVGDLDTQVVLLTEAVSWFRFQLDDQIGIAAENVIDAIDKKRVPDTLIMRILGVRVEEIPKSEETKFEQKRLVAEVQYIPVWMTAQGQW